MTDTLFDHLARREDKETSHLAAESLDLRLTAKHEAVIDWLTRNGPATDLELAEGLVRDGVFRREESARRAVRTVREEHGLMVPAVDDTGAVIRHVNSTGRAADCWTLGATKPASRKRAKAEARERILAYLTAAEESNGYGFPIDYADGVPLYSEDLREMLS
jgi:hypothetical protein